MPTDKPLQTKFETVLSTFEKSSSLGKKAFSEIAGLKSGQDVSVESILKGTKSIASNDIRKELANNLSLPDLPDNIIGSTAKFALNFTIDAALDPLTYIPAFGFIGKFIKGGKNLIPGITNTLIQKSARLGAVGAAAALIGTRFDENGAENALNNVGFGIATGIISSVVSKPAAGLFGKIGDELYNAYTKATLGKQYFDLGIIKNKAGKDISRFVGERELTGSKAFKIVKDHNKRVSSAKDAYLKIRTSFIEDIKKADNDGLIKRFVSVRDQGLNKTISLRNKYIDTKLKHINSLTKDGAKKITRLSQAELNSITAPVNTEVGREIDAVLKASGDKELTSFVKRYVKDNRRIISGYNAHKLNSSKDAFTAIIPIDFHGVDLLAPDAISDIYNLKKGSIPDGFGLLSKEKVAANAITLEQESAIGVQRFTDALATRIERRSLDMDRAIRQTGLTGIFGADVGKNFNHAIENYDKFASLWKSTVLGASVSWIKNNLFENTIRSVMKLGPIKGLKVSLNQLPVTDIFRRLYKIADPKNGFKNLNASDELLYLSKRIGVIETNFFDDLLKRTGSETKVVRLKRILDKTTNVDDIAELKKLIASETLTLPGKISNGFQDIIKATSGKVGQTVENGIRVGFFDEILKGELKHNQGLAKLVKKNGMINSMSNPEFKSIVEKSRDLVNEVFFDYGNVTAFEQKVLKRIIPFYGFYSKNISFWADILENGGKEIATTVRAIRATGRQPTERERQGIPDWVLNSFYTVSNDGKDIIRIPNISMADVLDNFSWKSAGTKLNPIIKLGIEQSSNNEFGLNQPVRPSTSKFGTKRLFARGLLFENIPGATGRDKNKNLVTTSDVVGTIDNIRGNLAPFPILDQILGARDNVVNKNKSIGSEVVNKLTPLRIRSLKDFSNVTKKRRRNALKLKLRTARKLRK